MHAVQHTAVQVKIKYVLLFGSNPKYWLGLAYSVFLLKLLFLQLISLQQIGNVYLKFQLYDLSVFQLRVLRGPILFLIVFHCFQIIVFIIILKC